MPLLLALYHVSEVYLVSLILHQILPAAKVQGYVCDFNGKPLDYRLNGLTVLITTSLTYACMWTMGLRSPVFFAQHFWSCTLAAIIIGLVLSIAVFLFDSTAYTAPDSQYTRSLTTDMTAKIVVREMEKLNPKSSSDTGSSSTSTQETAASESYKIIKYPAKDTSNRRNTPLKTFFLGNKFNPRFYTPINLQAPVDLKMMLYIWGAVMLELNLLSLAANSISLNPAALFEISSSSFLSLNGLTWAVGVYTFLVSWFVCDYMYFEHVHLYTYDLFAERVGFKLVWGCLAFYPFIYCSGGIPLSAFAPGLASATADLSLFSSACTIVLFYIGWMFTRGANMQKYHFKRNPLASSWFYGLVPQRSIPGSRILVSGFWGISRHANYLGETTQAIALALPAFLVTPYSAGFLKWFVMPWLYTIYCVALFVSRERDDNEVCRKKYGKAWEEYERLVPWRIVPFVY